MTGMTSLTNAPVSREAVANYLERDILSGQFEPGERLPSERQLAESLKVSRPIVREALRSLAERNLVEVRPGRGTFVLDPESAAAGNRLDSVYQMSRATPRDLVEARLMLECTAAEMAAERASETDLAVIETAVTMCEESPTIIERIRYDLSFHLAVARAAHNPVIETMFTSISDLAVELMFRSLSDPQVTKMSLPYHREVLDAIRNHDGDGANESMSGHLRVASQLYGNDYEESVERVAKRELNRLFTPGVTLEELISN